MPRRLKPYLASGVLILGPVLALIAFLSGPKQRPWASPESATVVVDSGRRPASAQSWKETRQKLGEHLEARLAGGRLLELTGSLEADRVKGFLSSDRASVSARAREIAALVTPHVGVAQKDWSRATVVPGAHSAQVYFEQSSQGLPLIPPGVVSMDLGPGGQLLHLDVRLFPGIEVEGEEKIPHTLAESIAREGAAAGLPTLAGRRALWIPHPDPTATRTVAYRVYEFMVGPRQVLVNATTGKVISRRDRGIR